VDEQETKKEMAQAKKDLLEAKAKLKELSAKLGDISDVIEKIEAAQGRLQKLEEELFLEGFSKKSYFHPIGNGKD
jgi:DNA repair exonuclease SbcCD ATPase subunit